MTEFLQELSLIMPKLEALIFGQILLITGKQEVFILETKLKN